MRAVAVTRYRRQSDMATRMTMRVEPVPVKRRAMVGSNIVERWRQMVSLSMPSGRKTDVSSLPSGVETEVERLFKTCVPCRVMQNFEDKVEGREMGEKWS